MNVKVNYNNIDVFKLIMSIFVVAIHTHPLENISNSVINGIYDSLVSLAVPFFFVATGFLVYEDVLNDTAFKTRFIKLLKMYLIWSIVYLPLAICEYIDKKYTIYYSVLLYIKDLLLVGEHYNSWVLWYLLSSIYALFIIRFLIRKSVTINIIVIIGFLLLIVSSGLDMIADNKLFFEEEFEFLKVLLNKTIYNGRILRGIVFISLGMKLKELMKKSQSPILTNKLALIVIFLLGFVISIFCDYIIGNLGLYIESVALFLLILGLKFKGLNYYKYMRKISVDIYFIHLYVWTILYTVIFQQKTYGMIMFVLTLLISIILSLFHILFCKRRKSCVA